MTLQINYSARGRDVYNLEKDEGHKRDGKTDLFASGRIWKVPAIVSFSRA